MKKTVLVKMKENQKGRVLEITGGYSIQNKFMSMGIYPGREITKLSHFALKGPVTIKTGRSVLALGHGMAAKIILEVE
ncbi:MAG: FeoA domain-containing protein [Candidatus Omnitrophica bacterium]|nr:FeoA domain-containing protein [Candidatus Omnitrophota bacterium]